MQVVVLVKSIPDASGEIKLDGDFRVKREGDGVLDPGDEFAVEAALKVAEAGQGELAAVSMGPPNAGVIAQRFTAEHRPARTSAPPDREVISAPPHVRRRTPRPVERPRGKMMAIATRTVRRDRLSLAFVIGSAGLGLCALIRRSTAPGCRVWRIVWARSAASSKSAAPRARGPGARRGSVADGSRKSVMTTLVPFLGRPLT